MTQAASPLRFRGGVATTVAEHSFVPLLAFPDETSAGDGRRTNGHMAGRAVGHSWPSRWFHPIIAAHQESSVPKPWCKQSCRKREG
jgi:hypothetical protein